MKISATAMIVTAWSAWTVAHATPLRIPGPHSDQAVQYDIQADLDAATRTVRGQMELIFTNTAARTIDAACVHLYPNAFRNMETVFMKTSRGCHRGKCLGRGQTGAMSLDAVSWESGTQIPIAPKLLDDGTIASLPLPIPLAPGLHARIRIRFTTTLPTLFARSGAIDDFFMLAQWYPKLAFLRDDGTWHCQPFHANEEFFAPFGSFTVSLTLPRDFVVGHTGFAVRDETTAERRALVMRANDVHDFALAAWPHFTVHEFSVDDMASSNDDPLRVRWLSVPGRQNEARMIELLQRSIIWLARAFGPYPYRQLTVVDTPLFARAAAAMEYPTLFTVWRPVWTPAAIHFFDEILVHELVHQYFQGMVASNEIDEPWLDEGLTTFVSGIMLDEFFGADRSTLSLPGLSLGQRDRLLLQARNTAQGTWPINRPAAKFPTAEAYGAGVYALPALLLREIDGRIGRAAMLDTLRSYYRQFAFAHPTTDDFRAALVARAPENQRDEINRLLDNALDRGTWHPSRSAPLPLASVLAAWFFDWNWEQTVLAIVTLICLLLGRSWIMAYLLKRRDYSSAVSYPWPSIARIFAASALVWGVTCTGVFAVFRIAERGYRWTATLPNELSIWIPQLVVALTLLCAVMAASLLLFAVTPHLVGNPRWRHALGLGLSALRRNPGKTLAQWLAYLVCWIGCVAGAGILLAYTVMRSK